MSDHNDQQKDSINHTDFNTSGPEDDGHEVSSPLTTSFIVRTSYDVVVADEDTPNTLSKLANLVELLCSTHA